MCLDLCVGNLAKAIEDNLYGEGSYGVKTALESFPSSFTDNLMHHSRYTVPEVIPDMRDYTHFDNPSLLDRASALAPEIDHVGERLHKNTLLKRSILGEEVLDRMRGAQGYGTRTRKRRNQADTFHPVPIKRMRSEFKPLDQVGVQPLPATDLNTGAKDQINALLAQL